MKLSKKNMVVIILEDTAGLFRYLIRVRISKNMADFPDSEP